MDEYDEDLLQNPFYKALVSKGKQLYLDATENRRTVSASFCLHYFYFKDNLYYDLSLCELIWCFSYAVFRENML